MTSSRPYLVVFGIVVFAAKCLSPGYTQVSFTTVTQRSQGPDYIGKESV